MSDFNEYIKKINDIMGNNIICVYYLFNTYAYKYYNNLGVFSIDVYENDEQPRYIDDDGEEYTLNIVSYRNTEDWFKNEFLVFLRKYFYKNIRELLITSQDMELYFEELTALMSLNNMDVTDKKLYKVISVYYSTYYVNNLTFEDFKTLLYENEIYNEVFMDDAVLK